MQRKKKLRVAILQFFPKYTVIQILTSLVDLLADQVVGVASFDKLFSIFDLLGLSLPGILAGSLADLEGVLFRTRTLLSSEFC